MFAYEDLGSEKLFLMLGTLEEYDSSEIKFIVQLEAPESEPKILISKQPIFNCN